MTRRSVLAALTMLTAVLACPLAPRTAAAQATSQRADTTIAYDVNGLRVIHHPRAAASTVIAVQLYLLGGSREVTLDNAGIESLLLMASEYGTRRYPGESARRALAETGSFTEIESTADWTVFGFHGIKQEFDSTWAVFSDRLMHPSLDSSALRIVRARMLDRVARRHTSPESHAWFVAESLAYRDHPYAVDPAGNPKSLQSLTVDDLRAYARDRFVTSRMLLVVVGDVTPDTVRRAVARTLGTLPRGEYTWTLPPAVRSVKPELVIVPRDIQTNYIVGYISGPARSSKEYPAFARAMMLLSGWLGHEVREKNALSYAAYVAVMDRGAPGAVLYISTTRPDSAIRVANRLLTRYEREFAVPRVILRRNAEWFKARYVYETESAATHAEMLARAQLYDGDYRAASRHADVMMKLAFLDLRNAVRTYAKNIQYAYVGDASKATATEFTKR